MEDKCYFSKVCCSDPSQCWLSVSSDNGCFLPPSIEEEEHLHKGNLYPAVRQKKKSREFFLCPLFLNCLKTTLHYYFKVSIGKKSRHNMTGFLAQGLTGMQVSSEAQVPLPSSLVVGKIHFLAAVGLRSPLSC